MRRAKERKVEGGGGGVCVWMGWRGARLVRQEIEGTSFGESRSRRDKRDPFV